MEPWVVSHFLAGARYWAIRRALSGFLSEYFSFHYIGEPFVPTISYRLDPAGLHFGLSDLVNLFITNLLLIATRRPARRAWPRSHDLMVVVWGTISDRPERRCNRIARAALAAVQRRRVLLN